VKRLSDVIFLSTLIFAFVAFGFTVFNQRYISMEGWETDFSQRSVELGEIMDVTLMSEMAMAIDNPTFEYANTVSDFHPATPVIVVEIDDQARAYPLAVLLRHEVVNDVVDGREIAVTYCPLCNSAVVYDRMLNGRTLEFAVTGNIRVSGLIMYDRQTESWWQQFTGHAIVGEYTGEKLETIPSTVVGFSQFVEYHPDGWVLTGDAMRPDLMYDSTRMIGYDSSITPEYFMGDIDERLPAMERVLATIIDEQPIAYSFGDLEERQVIHDEIGDMAIVAIWQPGALSVLDNQSIGQSQDVGMAVLFNREVDGVILRFSARDGRIYDIFTESEWNIFGEAISGEYAGTSLEHIESYPHFWFAWSATYPQTLLYSNFD